MNSRFKNRGGKPTFAQVGLQEALTAAFQVYRAEPGTHTVDASVFGALLGHDLSASALARLIGSLRTYDLIDRRRNGYALTDRAVQLFTTEDYLEFRARLGDVAVFPPLMRELSQNYGDQLDSRKLDADLTARQIVGRDRKTLIGVLRENERLLGHDLSCRDLFETFRAFRLRALRPSLGTGVAAVRSWLKSQRGRTVMLSTVAVLFAGTLIYFAARPGSQTVDGQVGGGRQGSAARDHTPRRVTPPVPEVSLPVLAGPVIPTNADPAAAFGPVPTGWAVTSSVATGAAITRLTATGRPGSLASGSSAIGPSATGPSVTGATATGTTATGAPAATRTRGASSTAPTAPVPTVSIPTTSAHAARVPVATIRTPTATAPTSSAASATASKPVVTRPPTTGAPLPAASASRPTVSTPAPTRTGAAAARSPEVAARRAASASPARPSGTQAPNPQAASAKPTSTFTANTQIPETQVPNTQLPDAQLPDARSPDAQLPDARSPDTQIPATQSPSIDAPGAATATAPAATVQPGNGQPYFPGTLTRGRELAGLFYSQRLTPLWSAFSPTLKAQWQGFAGFQTYRMGGLKAFGAEKTVTAEDVRQDSGVSYYTRTAIFALGSEKPWTLIVGLNSRGQVVEFNVVAAAVLPQADASLKH